MGIVSQLQRVLSGRGLVGFQLENCVSLERGKSVSSKVTLEMAIRDLEIALLYRDTLNPAEYIRTVVAEYTDDDGRIGLPLLEALQSAVEEAVSVVQDEGDSELRTSALTALEELRGAIGAAFEIIRYPDVSLNILLLRSQLKKCCEEVTRMGWSNLSDPIHTVLDNVGSRRLSEISRGNHLWRLKRAVSAVKRRVGLAKSWGLKPLAEASLETMLTAIDNYDPLENAEGATIGVVSFGVVTGASELKSFYRHMSYAYAQFVIAEARNLGAELEVIGSCLVIKYDGKEQVVDLEVPWQRMMNQ